jgi:glutathione S-transferase
MITLYHCHDARSFRPLWALEELGLDYDLKMLPFPPRWRAKEYLDLNPLGTIPLFIDGHARMTESAAIVQYIAGRYGDGLLDVAPSDPGYPAYLNGLHFGEATLTFPQTLVLRYSRLEPEERRLPKVAADYAKWFAARAGAYRFEDGYAAAGRFTAADISIGYALLLAHELGLQDLLPAHVLDYWARITDRDGYRRARAAQDSAAAAQAVAFTPVSQLGAAS